MSEKINFQFYAIMGATVNEVSGYNRVNSKTSRMTKNKPDLAASEVAVLVNIDLPIALFMKPAISVKLDIPGLDSPLIITPDLASNIADVLHDRLGIRMTVVAAEPEA